MLSEIFGNKKLVSYIVINIVISALTALLVIFLWTRFALSSPPAELLGSNGSAFEGQLVISTVVGADDLENERVVIQHRGVEDISLSGWKLRDSSGSEFRFPALVLHPGAQVTIFSRIGDDSATQLFWDRQVPVWDSGETVTLLDPTGQVKATYKVP